MSPLARSLLALAVAALLQGACAMIPTPDQCTTAESGRKYGREVTFDDKIYKYVQDDELVIPNNCYADEKLFGERVTVCDDRAPVVVLPPWPQCSPAAVHRTGAFYNDDAPVYITQWCA